MVEKLKSAQSILSWSICGCCYATDIGQFYLDLWNLYCFHHPQSKAQSYESITVKKTETFIRRHVWQRSEPIWSRYIESEAVQRWYNKLATKFQSTLCVRLRQTQNSIDCVYISQHCSHEPVVLTAEVPASHVQAWTPLLFQNFWIRIRDRNLRIQLLFRLRQLSIQPKFSNVCT